MSIPRLLLKKRQPDVRKRALVFERLGARIAMDGSGLGVSDPMPWFDPGSLSYSFAPDGTSVAGRENRLFATLERLGSPEDWQSQFDAAFHAWLSPLNVGIQQVADAGSDFGVAGPTQGDPRFGDIRIAAIPLSENVLATSIPHSAMVQGTWAGDILLNANAPWQSLQEVFSVALHEFGHILGLPHRDDPGSIMFVHGVNDFTAPSSDDIESLRRLYAGIDFVSKPDDGDHASDEEATESHPLASAEDFAEESHEGTERHGDFDLSLAIPLLPSAGTTIRYTAETNVGPADSIFIYRLEPAATRSEEIENLHVAWQSTGAQWLDADVSIVDQGGNLIESEELHHGQGSVVLQARDLESDRANYVIVKPLPGSNSLPASFEMVVDYGPELRLSHKIGEIKFDAQHSALEQRFSVASTRLVHLHLEIAGRIDASTTARAFLVNAAGETLTEVSLHPGEARSAPLTFLDVGDYVLWYVLDQANDRSEPEIQMQVFLDEVSLDIGPGVTDPTGLPYLPCEEPLANPGYCYVYVPITPSPPTVSQNSGNPIVPPTPVPERPVSGTPTPPPLPSLPVPAPLIPVDTPPADQPGAPTGPADPLRTVSQPTAAINGNSNLSPRQNQLNRFDVNGNDLVTALDALIVINYMGRQRLSDAEFSSQPRGVFADVNGDFQVSAIDALMVINSMAIPQGGGAEAVYPAIPLDSMQPPVKSDQGHRTTDAALVLLF